MSHSLHRMGTKENLNNDFTVVVRPEIKLNGAGSKQKLEKILQAMYDCHAVDICSARGENYKGNIHMTSIENIVHGVGEGKSIFAAFDSADNVEAFLRFLVKEDFGLSVVVQGLCENVEKILEKVGLKVHTTNHSLGIHGKTSMLHDKSILEVSTMCGHGLTSPYLVMQCIEDVKSGKMSAHDAAVVLAKPCVCGIFNTTRAEELLKRFL